VLPTREVKSLPHFSAPGWRSLCKLRYRFGFFSNVSKHKGQQIATISPSTRMWQKPSPSKTDLPQTMQCFSQSICQASESSMLIGGKVMFQTTPRLAPQLLPKIGAFLAHASNYNCFAHPSIFRCDLLIKVSFFVVPSTTPKAWCDSECRTAGSTLSSF
jgi:hypothetical protein